MEYLLGALGTAFFFSCMYGAYKAGQRSRKPIQREIDHDQAERARKLKQGFEQLMSYDVSKATGRKG